MNKKVDYVQAISTINLFPTKQRKRTSRFKSEPRKIESQFILVTEVCLH